MGALYNEGGLARGVVMVQACDPGSGLPQETRTAGLVEICGPLELPPGHMGVLLRGLLDPA